MANLITMDNISGATAASTWDSSRTDSNTEKENGRKHRTLSYAIITRASTLWIRKMDTECFHGKVATSTKATIKMTRETAMGKCSGLMVPCTREFGSKESSTEWVR